MSNPARTLDIIDNFGAPFRIAYAYFMRTRPIETMLINSIEYLKNFITANQRRKIAKYRVYHYMYRLQQMENLIEQNNPHNNLLGKKINHLR